MIKWPEPVGTVTDDMQMFWTSFGLNEDTPKGTKVHTEAQLKQAVRDAYEEAAKVAQETVCDTHIPTGINIYGTRAAKAIRALIKQGGQQ